MKILTVILLFYCIISASSAFASSPSLLRQQLRAKFSAARHVINSMYGVESRTIDFIKLFKRLYAVLSEAHLLYAGKFSTDERSIYEFIRDYEAVATLDDVARHELHFYLHKAVDLKSDLLMQLSRQEQSLSKGDLAMLQTIDVMLGGVHVPHS